MRSLVQGRAATRGESREPRRASRPCRSRAPRPRAPVPTPARAPAAGAHGRSRAGFSANGRAACRLRAGAARNGRGAPGAPGRGRPRQPPCAWLLCAPSAPRRPTRRPVLSPARPSCAGHQVGLRQRRPRGSALSVRELVRRAPPARASAIRLPSAPARRPRCCRRGGPPRVLGESFRAARVAPWFIPRRARLQSGGLGLGRGLLTCFSVHGSCCGVKSKNLSPSLRSQRKFPVLFPDYPVIFLLGKMLSHLRSEIPRAPRAPWPLCWWRPGQARSRLPEVRPRRLPVRAAALRPVSCADVSPCCNSILLERACQREKAG